MKKLLILLLLSCKLFSQDKHYIDSIKVLTQSKIDTIRFRAYSELVWVLKDINKKDALYYATNLLNESLNANKQNWIAQGYNDIGIIYIRSGDLNKALFNIEKSLAIREKLGNKKDIASSLSKIANIKTEDGKYGEAIVIQLKTLKLYEELNIQPYIAHTCNNLGQLYNDIHKYSLSNEFLLRAFNIEKEIGDIHGMPITLSIMGNNYTTLQQSDSSIKYFSVAKKLLKENGDYKSYSIACNNLGLIYKNLKINEKAKENYTEAIEMSTQIGDSGSVALFENNLARILIEEWKFDEAEKILSNSLKISIKLGSGLNVLKIYETLTILYIQKKDSEKANFYFTKFHQTNDSIFSIQTSLQFSEAQTKFEVDKKDLEIAKNKAEITNEKNKRFITYGALGFFIALFSIAIWAFYQKRKSNKLLENKNNLITHQKEELSEKQKEIVDSINYAKKIQNALLANEEILLSNLLDHFVLFKPKDIVSGDFTWATINDNLFYIACCDSTGHGVPGAFMSLLNIGFLSEAVKERNIKEPGKIFDYVRSRLIETIGNDDQKDGFDGILLCIDTLTKNITYAAANNAPMIISKNEIIYLNTNKMPVGEGVKTDSFNTFNLNYSKGDLLYLFTDGYPDQFGGPKGKKYKYKQFEELLLAHSTHSTKHQKEQLEYSFEMWRGKLEQVDDVCVVGIVL